MIGRFTYFALSTFKKTTMEINHDVERAIIVSIKTIVVFKETQTFFVLYTCVISEYRLGIYVYVVFNVM